MKKNLKRILPFAAMLALCACQHDIDPDDLEFPPEEVSAGVAVSSVSTEEAEAELKKLSEEPYPPYTVQGGDSFRIKVYNEEDLDARGDSKTVITPDGYLVMGLIDPVCVKDLTIIEATEKVKEALGKFVKHPQVSLIPESIQGKSATLYGSVNEPGSYTVSSNTRLSDFVARGKGFKSGLLDSSTVDLADISNSYIIRNDKMLPVNFTEALIKGNQKHNVRIFPNDIVYIAKKEDSRVIIMGEVNIPRVMNWTNTLTVSEVIAYAGGLKPEYWGTLLILRKPKDPGKGSLDVYKVDVNDLLAGRCKDFLVASGDILYIPKDSMSEYNMFVNKLMPTAQFINLLISPAAYWFGPRN